MGLLTFEDHSYVSSPVRKKDIEDNSQPMAIFTRWKTQTKLIGWILTLTCMDLEKLS